MKTLEGLISTRSELIKERDELCAKRIDESYTEKQYKVDQKRIKRIIKDVAFISECIRYVETCPDEHFLRAQLEDLEERVRVVNVRFAEYQDHFPDDIKNKKSSEQKAWWRAKHRVSDMVKRIDTLRYLIN